MDFKSLYSTKTSLIPNNVAKPKVSIIGIPFDSTSIEYPGQRFGPKSIRETISRFYGYEPENYNNNFYQNIEDLGDIDIVHGSFEETQKNVESFINDFKEQRKTIPFFLGGEHLISLATIKALTNNKKEKIDLVVFDAHADCYDTYKGEKYSHISWLNKVINSNIVNHVYLIGTRAIDKDEMSFINKQIKLKKLTLIDNPKKLDTIVKKLNKKNIYISIDLDVLDFDLAIGTGTPEFDGLDIYDLINTLENLIAKNKLVGLDIVELNPMIDNSRITSYCAAQILKKCILKV